MLGINNFFLMCHHRDVIVTNVKFCSRFQRLFCTCKSCCLSLHFCVSIDVIADVWRHVKSRLFTFASFPQLLFFNERNSPTHPSTDLGQNRTYFYEFKSQALDHEGSATAHRGINSSCEEKLNRVFFRNGQFDRNDVKCRAGRGGAGGGGKKVL